MIHSCYMITQLKIRKIRLTVILKVITLNLQVTEQ